MDSKEQQIEGIEERHRRRSRRKHRYFWKRRQFWIAIFAVLVAVLLVIWLVSSLGSHHSELE